MRRRGEMVERSFAHILDRRGMRRAWLRGRENLHKRYLIHVAGFNLGVLMRALYGRGTPREAADAVSVLIFVLQSDAVLVFALIATVDGELAAIVFVAADPTRNLKTGLRQRADSLTVSQVGSLATGASGQSPGDTSGQPNADACDGRFDVAFCSDRGIRGVENRWIGQAF
jgi:hypothetical protein